MSRVIPMIDSIYRVATAAATYVIQSSIKHPGQILVVDTIGITNLDTNNKDVTIGINVAGREMWLHTIQGVDAGEYFSWQPHMRISSEHRLLFKVEDPNLGNRTLITIVGHYIEEE